MDEEKEKNVCLGSVSESTTVSVREHVAGETQVEGSLLVGVERVEDGGSCNGDDIMVEVLGSDVYVDGVCTHGEGGRCGLAEDESGGSGDGKSVEGDGKSLVRNGGRSALSLRGIGVSGGEASNLQSEMGVECSLGMAESSGKQARVVKAEKVEVTMREGGCMGERPVGGEGQKETVGTGRRNDDLTRQDVTCLDGEAQNTAIGAGDGGSLAVTVSTCVETHNVHVEEVVVVAGEAVLEKEMVEVGAERGREVIGGGSDGIEGTNTKEVVVFDDKEKTTRLENGVGDSSVVVGSLGVETQVVKEDGMTETVEGLESGLIVEGAEDRSELAYVGLDAANNFSNQEVGVGDDEVWNPGIDGNAVSTELVVEKSSLQRQDFKEKVPVMVTEEMNPKIVTSGSCALEGVVCNSGREQSSIAEPTFGGTKKDAASSKSLDEESKAAATGEVAAMDEGGTLCSKVGGVKSDAIDGNTTFSLEKQLEKFDKFGESFENHIDVSSNLVSSCPPNQGVVGGDNTVMDDKGFLNSESDQHFNHEEDLDKIIARDPALMEVDEQVIDAESVCLCGGGIEGIEEQSVKVETTCVSTVSQSNVSADLTSNQVVIGGEAAAAKDDEVFSDSNAVVLETTAKAREPDCSESDQKLKAETVCGSTQGDAQVTDVREAALMDCEAILDSNCEVPGAAEKNKLLESGMCLEKGMAGDLFIDSNIGQETEVKIQVVNAECADATSSHQPTQVVAEAEVAAVEGNFLLNPNVETDTQVIVGEEIVPGGIEVLNSNMDIAGSVEFEECIEKSLAGDFAHLDAKSGLQVEVGGQEMIGEQVDLHGEQEMEVEDNIAYTELSKADEEKFVERADLNSGSVVKVHQAHYLLPSENEGEFSISDLVWGKVRSHPWWPGQIFDPADSSEKAMKHHKKDCFLVAYFGDRTFAWNEASQLKPFQTHFSHEEKHSNSEAFQNAVECALEEVSRRVELGLTCSCIPQDAYEKIQFQIVENTGIREEVSTRPSVVRTANSSYFEPDKLMEYMKALARFPSGGSDQLELVIAKAQLLSFYRLKGYCSLPDLQFCGHLLESDTDTVVSEDRMHSSEVFEHASALYKDDDLTSSKQEISKGQNSSINKRKHNLKDDVLYKKKERSQSKLMGDSADGDNWSDGKTAGNLVSSSSGKKRKTVEYHDDHGPQDGRKTISFAKVSNTSPSSFPKPSFKIGDCIRRVASQLTGSHSILKCNSERFQKLDGSNEIPAGDEADFSFLDSVDAETERMIDTTDYSSLDDLLSQLLGAAQDPLKGNSFSNIIASFFSDFRNSVLVGQPSDREFLALDKVGRRKRSSHSVGGPPETFEFEDMSDTYWTDRVIQNGSEEQPPRKNRKREYQIVPVVLENPLQVSRRPYSRKRYSDGNQVVADDKPAGYVDENSPAEIVMNFSEVRSVPSETNLNKMFRHFGPLKESETEVDRDTSRARVVFKKSSDAEVAFNSAGRFKIFGPTLVNYQINYTPCALFKASPMDIAQDHEMQLDLAALEVDLV